MGEITIRQSQAAFHQNTAPAVTFREQAEWWLASLSKRKRRPIKPATASGWRDALNAWLLPNLGDKLLADVSNKALRELVEKMSAANRSAKTIVSYVQVVKLVVASAVNEEGEQIYPRVWNHDFCQVPIIRKDKQRRPSVTPDELKDILSSLKKPKYKISSRSWRLQVCVWVKPSLSAQPTSVQIAECCTSAEAFGVARNKNLKHPMPCEL
jgi:integrase